MSPEQSHAMDHVVLVLFENRSFDNLLGRLYQSQDGKTFEGVADKELTNPVPPWAEHQPPDGSALVHYSTTDDMDAPNPDSGEEWFHTNTQVFGVVDDHNRLQSGSDVTSPWNTPPAGAVADMSGFVNDYISTFTWEMGRQPTYEEYRKIMTGYTPEQLPVLAGLARDFGVFDHWFSEVPSQTFMNRSFWTAATCTPLPTGGTINNPSSHWISDNTAETIFDRLDSLGKSWRVYVQDDSHISFTGFIHTPRLKDKFATHFLPFSQFEKDAANGELPDFSLIEPNLVLGHGDYHPAEGRSLIADTPIPGMDPPSSILAGEAFLKTLYDTYRNMRSPKGANVWNTTLFIGWDEPGGTYDHVPPGAAVPPDPAAPAGQFGFRFDRSGYRVPAIVVSPWVESGSVYNREHRHTSLLATMREAWQLGEPFTERDKGAPSISYVFEREVPRDPEDWIDPAARPVPASQIDFEKADKELSTLGKAALPGIIAQAKEKGIPLPPEVDEPDFHLTEELARDVVSLIGAYIWPNLGPQGDDLEALKARVGVDLTAATKG